MKALIKEKTIAFLVHLSISAFVAISCVGLVFGLLYPGVFSKAADVSYLFFLMIAIDIILGPLLTFVIYKKGKKTLKFDLFVIGLLQVSALIYGLYSVYIARPAYVAYDKGIFHLVRVHEIEKTHMNLAHEQYKKQNLFGVDYVFVRNQFVSKQERDRIYFDEYLANVPAFIKPEMYLPYSENSIQATKAAMNLNKLYDYNENEKVNRVLEEHSSANGFIPLKANAIDMTVLIQKQTGRIVAIVDLRPWKS